jgi:hypothetical protein
VIAGVTLHFHSGRLHAGRHAADNPGELSDHPQKLRLGYRRLYGHRGIYPATADAEREQFIVPRFIDTITGCLIAFGGMLWLWPQWQSGLLRKNAHDALEADQEAIRLILSNDPQATPLAYQRMRVNQAHNALFNSLNQAMQEPGLTRTIWRT